MRQNIFPYNEMFNGDVHENTNYFQIDERKFSRKKKGNSEKLMFYL